MARIESKLRPGDPAFQANRQRNEALAAELRERLAVAQAGGPEDARRKHTERGKLLPRQRVESLLDPGTAFGGMGSSREMTVAALTEPTIAIAVLTLALTTGSTSLGAIAGTVLKTPAYAIGPGHALAFAAFLIALIAETGRLPVDNPSTHLELTMIHEAMILEYSGPYLALIEWAAAVRLTLLLTLAANLFLPWGMATSLAPVALVAALLAIVVKLAILGLLLALLETRVAKLRLFRVPELLALSFTLALLAAASSFFTK